MPLRVGTASPSTGPTKAATLRQLANLARQAASQNIDILLLPEAYIGGYPRGTAFGCVIGERTHEGREEFAGYFDAAADLGDTIGGGAGAGQRWVRRELAEDGDTSRGDGTREELEKIARDTGVFVVTGVVEKAGGSLYCAAVYVCPKEGIIGKRRKVLPTGLERLIWAQGCPSTLRAVSTVIRGVRVNLAAAICWENYMPGVRQALYAQNVNLFLAPTADGRDTWLSLMRTIGVEGRCFVVSSNMAVRKDSGPGGASTQQTEAENGRNGRLRRNSTLTAEGFEIALPAQDPTPGSATRHRRRKSVFDEDGNEIVLCRDKKSRRQTNGHSSENQQSVSNTSVAKSNGSQVGWESRGGSCIVSPFGDVLAGPQWEDDEGLLFADIDMRDCIRGRLDIDMAGSYSRNDSFTFSVRGLDLDPLPY